MKEIPIVEKELLIDCSINTSSRKQRRLVVGKTIKSKMFGKKFKFKYKDRQLFALVK